VRRWRCLVGSGLILIAAVPAHGEDSWYIAATAGAYVRDSHVGPVTFTSGNTKAPGTLDREFDPGALLGLNVGYKLPDGFRIEGEFGYLRYVNGKIKPSVAAFPALNGSNFALLSGDLYNRYTGTINVLYDIPLELSWTPYVGGGLGYAHSDGVISQHVNSIGTILHGMTAARDTAVALIELGITIPITDSWSVVPGYRYVHFFVNPDRSGDEVAHVAKVEVRYAF
jgi:opacity protein-like surface antigen